MEQSESIVLSAEQKRHIFPSPSKHQRLRGVAGSGKSLVLAQRAANLAATGKKILIVTFNITLWHYIRDLVSKARVGFAWEKIEFTHFHGFCRNFLAENDVVWPTEDKDKLFDETVPHLVIDTLRSGKNKKHRQYDAVLIDEGQDFQKLWYETLCEFLTENDEVLVVFDDRQNVYSRNTGWLDSVAGTKFNRKWRELKESHRLPFVILEQANKFAEMFFPTTGAKLESVPNVYQTSLFDPYFAWKDVSSFEQAKHEVFAIFDWLTKTKTTSPSDIVILLPTHLEGWELVKEFESRNIRVNHVFELSFRAK